MKQRAATLPPSRRPEKGFTLVEVLVSVVILSFGLLGMVGLQASSLQANRDARLQSTAVVLARELAEMMRGNKDVALATGSAFLGSFTTSLVPATPNYCLSVGSTCATATDVAAAELTEWLARVDSELPGAQVTICHDSAPFHPTTSLPQWACTGAAADPIVIKIGWTRADTRVGSGALSLADRPSVVLSATPGSTV
jgi:type IV pilus assembly protein PilV